MSRPNWDYDEDQPIDGQFVVLVAILLPFILLALVVDWVRGLGKEKESGDRIA